MSRFHRHVQSGDRYFITVFILAAHHRELFKAVEAVVARLV